MSEHDGVAVIVKAMKHWAGSGGVQCNGCLAIVSLVRAESEVCQVRACPTLPGCFAHHRKSGSSAAAALQHNHSSGIAGLIGPGTFCFAATVNCIVRGIMSVLH